MSNIVIDIAAQFTGKKAFDKSEKAVNKLGKTLKKAVIGVGLTKVLTDSVKAFAADEKAAANLANTLQNLGLATFTASVESMIDKIQLATGIMDDELRPAFQTLVTSTGSAIKAQELLKLALDVSAGSGKDLASVSSDIAKVIAGNTKGLGKYSLGLSKAEIAILSTDDALKILMGTFSGASEKASKTFGASMLRIKAAVESAKESLGAGLVDGLMTATGSANIEELQQNILDFGVSAGNTFRKLGEIVRENLGLLKTLGVTFAAIWTAAKVAAGIEAIIILITRLNKAYKYLRATSVGAAIAQMAVLNPVGALAWGATLVAAITVAVRSLDLLTDKFNGASDAADNLAKPRIYGGIYADKYLKEKAAFEKKQIADQLARDKAAAAAKIKADKLAAANKAKLSKAAANFDLNKIQIAAALRATYDKDERLRLLAMQEIENDNGEAALKYIEQLALLTKEQQTDKLNGINAISQSELNSINKILLDELTRISSTKMSQEAADAARAEAYRQYNAAIISSGGLAAANFYTEKTQTDLLKIAKLAALHDVATAQATLDILNYTTQTDIIARIAAAQKMADDAKYAALQDYLALLAKPLPTPGVSGNDGGGGGGGSQGPKFGIGGQPIWDDGMGGPGYGTGLGTGTGSVDNSVTIVVEGSVLDGEDFSDIINRAMLDNIRRGLSQFPAGTLPG